MHLFQKRAVAFLDVLGFKDLITKAERTPSDQSKLIGLRAILDSHVRFDNEGLRDVPEEMQPKYLFISDSIILSTPADHPTIDGLQVVMLKTIQIAQKLFEAGFLVRGGVAVGNVWHDERNIFGTGYIESYMTEQAAKHPRVVLSATATKAWNANDQRFMPDLCEQGSDGRLEIALLHQAYVRSAGVGYELFYNQVRAHILNALETLPLGSDPRSKWEWIVQFFNAAVARYQIGVKPIGELPFPSDD